jgi:hypothetical protein
MARGKGEMAKGGGRAAKGKVGMAKYESEGSEDAGPVVRDRTSNRIYDLAGRTQRFGSAVVTYARGVPVPKSEIEPQSTQRFRGYGAES